MDRQSVGRHYRKELGSKYFAWQREVGEVGGYLNRWKFQEHVDNKAVIVDFGCGGGDLLAGLPAGRRIGVEPNVDARKVAAAKGIEVYEIANELPTEVADVVISNHALEHTLYPLSELYELRRSLKRNGKLIMWLPLDNWHQHREVNQADLSNDNNHHIYAWTPLTLANLLAEAGFQPLRVRVVPYAWPKGTRYFYRWMPEVIFDAAAYLMATVTRRYQVMAIAEPRH